MKLKFFLVVTHNNTFHADDVIAVALLRHAGYNFQYCRTRDPNFLEPGLANKETLVLDVGGKYEPSLLNFDHHQDNALQSAAGLIYQEIKDEICAPEEQPFFEQFIASIDAIDTNRDHIYHLWEQLPDGFRNTSQILGCFNRQVDDADMQDHQFERAVVAAETIIQNEVFNAWMKARSEQEYRRRIINIRNNVAIFDEYNAVWREKKEHLFAVMPHATGWQVQSADIAIETIPESVKDWPGFVFRHSNGFMAVLKERSDALAFIATLPHYVDLKPATFEGFPKSEKVSYQILDKLHKERIFKVWANNGSDIEYPNKGLHILESCDGHFAVDLTKKEALQLIYELQSLVATIPD